MRKAVIIFTAAVIIGSLTAVSSYGQAGPIQTPLHVGASLPIADEFDRKLNGTASAPGDCVQFLWATNGTAYPPTTNGLPHPANAPVKNINAAIGNLAPSGMTNPAVFGLSIAGTARPGSGRFFVRVFNHELPTEATFYGDSPIFTINGNKEFDVQITKTDQPVDPNDDDADGLNNSWEQSLGSDSGNADTDGDGMIDGDEFIAQTGITDPDSLLMVVRILPGGGDDALIRWDSVSNVTYQMQMSTDGLEVNPEYVNVGDPLTATGAISEMIIPDGLLDADRCYRVSVVE